VAAPQASKSTTAATAALLSTKYLPADLTVGPLSGRSHPAHTPPPAGTPASAQATRPPAVQPGDAGPAAWGAHGETTRTSRR